jgi:DNA-binding CsgD family transcriptional regulator
LVDRGGVLHVGDHQLSELLRSEWPDWSGRLVPPLLLQHMGADSMYRGEKLSARFHSVGDFWLLDLRANLWGGNLSKREEQIATLFAEGVNYKALAKVTGISPNTVRCHLREIYRKLGISNKTDLVRKMAENTDVDLSAGGASIVDDFAHR